MQYYKVIKNNRVIDVLSSLIFCKYNKKHNSMRLCDESEAEGIISSDNKYIWHVIGYPRLDGYDSVELVEIDQYEYDQLHVLNMKTPEEIIDAYTVALINGGVF